ncbi:MAG: GDSL-type esterase/lipase family protein [Kibdelosporangium sp.]
MYIPPRRSRDSGAACTRLPRLLSVATVGVVTLAAVVGFVPVAAAQPQAGEGPGLVVDIVGDSYAAGAGIRDTYIDPADPRHRSLVAPALQALSRIASGNPALRVDANVAASAGAVTADFFNDQKGQSGQGGETLVNGAQHDQVRPGAELVIVGFGGNDAQFAQVLADARQAGGSSALDIRIRGLSALLDTTATDKEYLGQAASSKIGQAPTLVARLLQVLAGVSKRAPHAKIVVTNYPLAIDPQTKQAAGGPGERELTSVRKFAYDLNRAIERAVQICQCATLVDLSQAVAGHEAYTGDSAFNEAPGPQTQRELFQPNQKGASLMANPIAAGVAKLLEVSAPAQSDGTVTVPKNIRTTTGIPDRDGDAVPDFRDQAPDDPTRSQRAARPTGDPALGKHQSGEAKSNAAKAKRDSAPKRHTPVRSPKPAVRDRSTSSVPAVVTHVVHKVVPPVQNHANPDRDRRAPDPVPAVTRPVPPQDKDNSTKSPPVESAPPQVSAPKRPSDATRWKAAKRIVDAEASERKPDQARTARDAKEKSAAKSWRRAVVAPARARTDKATESDEPAPGIPAADKSAAGKKATGKVIGWKKSIAQPEQEGTAS